MNKPIFKKSRKSPSRVNHSPLLSESFDQNKYANNGHNAFNATSTERTNVVSQSPLVASQFSGKTMSSKRVPELMVENDELKTQIDKLKQQRKLLMTRYEDAVQLGQSYLTKRDKSEDYSFKKSLMNIQKQIISATSRHQNTMRQNIFNKSFHSSRSRDNEHIPSKDTNVMHTGNTDRFQAHNKYRDSSSRDSKNTSLLSVNKSKRSKTNKQSMEERFYKYCKDELVKANAQNTVLQMKVAQLEAKIVQLEKQNVMVNAENQKVKQHNQFLQKRSAQQSQRIKKLNQQIEESFKKKDQNYQAEFQKFEIRNDQLNSYLKQSKMENQEKAHQIESLKSQLKQISEKYKDYPELTQKNIFLQNEISQWMSRNQKLKEKFIKNPSIDHLWEIKQVEYSNLVTLISTSKQLLAEQSNEKNNANLTFGRNTPNKNRVR